MWTSGEQAGLSQEQIIEIVHKLWRTELDNIMENCPDCCCKVGEQHDEGCDIARCTNCGGQRLSCDCNDGEPDTWDGLWPGIRECYNNRWITQLRPGEWMFDLNRAAIERQKQKNKK